MYPVAMVYKESPEIPVQKGGVVFLSDDLKHDYHQVEVFKQHIMDIYEERIGVHPKLWIRFSDQCSAQFKSRYTVQKLLEAPESLNLDSKVVHMHYFEVGEGKNMSDELGSIFKRIYISAVARNKDINARSAEDISKIIKENLSSYTQKKFIP